MDTADGTTGWHVDKTINLPSVFSLLVVAVTGIWWLANLQAQVNQNTLELVQWKVTWAQFLVNRETVVRSYEAFKATQETLSNETLRRLAEIRDEQRRVSDALDKRDGRP